MNWGRSADVDAMGIDAVAAAALAVVGNCVLAARSTAVAPLAQMEADTSDRMGTPHGADDAR